MANTAMIKWTTIPLVSTDYDFTKYEITTYHIETQYLCQSVLHDRSNIPAKHLSFLYTRQPKGNMVITRYWNVCDYCKDEMNKDMNDHTLYVR